MDSSLRNADFNPIDLERTPEGRHVAKKPPPAGDQRGPGAGHVAQTMKMESVGRLAGGVAHDFNNILTVIGGFCDVVLEQFQSDNQVFQDLMEIKKATDRGSSLTRQLLAFSHHRHSDPQLLDLNQIVRDTKRMLERLVGEDIDLKLSLREGVAPIYGETSQVERVLLNLVVNARDAMPNGGPLLIETNHDTREAGETNGVRLSITDAGTGIPLDLQSQLFEPFFTTKNEGFGTGLGLATTLEIVRELGGSIEVDSQVNQGTTFHIAFPRIHDAAAREQVEPCVNAAFLGKETILLVDDEAAIRGLLERVLADCGYRVITAGDGVEAIEKIRAQHHPIDLLLADVVLPKASGRQVADETVLHFPRAKVLYISGYTEETILSKKVRIDDDAFLHKPFSPQALTRRIRDLLDGKLSRSNG